MLLCLFQGVALWSNTGHYYVPIPVEGAKKGRIRLFSLNQFLNIGTIDIFGRLFFVEEGCSVHRRVFNSIPGLNTLDASSIPLTPSSVNENDFRPAKYPLGGHILLLHIFFG